MLPAMLGVVLEPADRDFLEAIHNGWDVDRNCRIWRQMKRIGAVRMRPFVFSRFPFVGIRPKLSEIGEDMLYECIRAPKQERWFVGSDILG